MKDLKEIILERKINEGTWTYEELLEELELKEKELQEVKQALEKQEEETKLLEV